MRRYQGVLLDVDGTLVDSNDAHAYAWVDTLAEYSFEVDFARVRKLIGMGGDRLIEALTGIAKDSPVAKRIGERRSQIFRERWLAKVTPLDGARELVLRLRAEGYQYAIASAARDEELAPLLELAGITDLVPCRTTSSDVPESKPDPATIEAALRCVSVDRSRVVMIGDTPYDLEASRGAGVDMIGFTSGGWSGEALAGAVAIYAGPASLLASWKQSPLAASRAA
jgi:phosphoglycolate phosphatase-like HAD superfamily hydrolase